MFLSEEIRCFDSQVPDLLLGALLLGALLLGALLLGALLLGALLLGALLLGALLSWDELPSLIKRVTKGRGYQPFPFPLDESPMIARGISCISL